MSEKSKLEGWQSAIREEEMSDNGPKMIEADTQVMCGKCGLPIHSSEPVRSYGFFVAHQENRCLELLKAKLKWDGFTERRDYSEFAKRVLGAERYDNSPCQAHPLELVELYVRELEAVNNDKQPADGVVVVPMESLLQRIMSRLTDMLDDDKFNEIDGMVRDAGYAPPLLAAAKGSRK